MTDEALADHSSDQESVAVECLHSVLCDLAAAAADSEVTGILLGTKDDVSVRILAYRRLVPKRALGRSGSLSEADVEAVARLMGGPPLEGELYGLEPVGWFRAQPRRQLVAAGWELDLLNTLFTEERQVGMLLLPGAAGPARARFYVRERDGFQADSYRELTIPAASPSPMVAVQPGIPRPETTPPPLQPDLERLAEDFVRFPEPEPLTFSQQVRGWIWRAVSSLAIVIFVLGYWWWTAVRQQAAPAPPRQPDVLAEADRQVSGNSFAGAVDLSSQAADPLLRDLPAPPDLPAEARTPEETARSWNDRADLTKELPPARDASRNLPAQAPVREPDRPLRPLRLPATPIRNNGKPIDLAPPPMVAHQTAPSIALPLPQSLTVVPPPKPAPALPAAPAPSKGALIWTGRLRKNATLVIDGKTASFGTLTGELPGKPVQLNVYPGDLGDYGILVFTNRPQDARTGWDAAGPQNGWNRVMYEFDPHNASGIEVAEAPGPQNAWKRLVLRCNNPKLSVVYVKWSLAR